MIDYISELLNLLTLGGDIFIIFILILILYENIIIKRRSSIGRFFKYFISKNYLFLAFLLVLIATLGSLYYSEILNYPPCNLCWWQRILIYPQVIMFSIAIIKKDKSIISYSLALSVIGLLISGFHYQLQITGNQSAFCSIFDSGASCAQTFFIKYGYITIPIMAITLFLLLIILGLFSKNPIQTNLNSQKEH